MAVTDKDPVPVLPYKFDEAAFKAKIDSLTVACNAVAGKKNYNPFVWFKQNVQPKVDSFAKGGRSKELFDSLIALPDAVPVIDENYVEEVPSRPVVQVPAGPKLGATSVTKKH